MSLYRILIILKFNCLGFHRLFDVFQSYGILCEKLVSLCTFRIASLRPSSGEVDLKGNNVRENILIIVYILRVFMSANYKKLLKILILS